MQSLRDELNESPEHLSPILTGFQGLDGRLTTGLPRSGVVILAGCTSVGKSAFALNIALAVARQGKRVGIFTLEQTREQVEMRLLASEARVDIYRLRIGMTSKEEESRLLDASDTLTNLPIIINDTPKQTISYIKEEAHRVSAEQGLDLLIIDYLQLIAGDGHPEYRVQEMSEISRSSKALARELEIPIVACSQLSRGIEQRPGHRPVLSDLRDSGSIGEDADVVVFIHREVMWLTEEEWTRCYPERVYPENIAEIIVAKNRNGLTGTLPFNFHSDSMRYEELALLSIDV